MVPGHRYDGTRMSPRCPRPPPLSWGRLGLSPHHAEDGIDYDVDGDGGWPPPVPHGPHALLVVGQQVIRQPPQRGPGGVVGLEAAPAPGWEGEQFQVDI